MIPSQPARQRIGSRSKCDCTHLLVPHKACGLARTLALLVKVAIDVMIPARTKVRGTKVRCTLNYISVTVF